MIEGVDQLTLAAELGVTDRRVRQLVEQSLLPQPDGETSRWDLQTCRERYRLYRAGSERDWDRFSDELKADAETVQRQCFSTERPSVTVQDLQRAIAAARDLWSRMKFLTAARSKSDAERKLFLLIWREREEAMLGALAERLMEIGETKKSSKRRRTSRKGSK